MSSYNQQKASMDFDPRFAGVEGVKQHSKLRVAEKKAKKTIQKAFKRFNKWLILTFSNTDNDYVYDHQLKRS